MLSLRRKKHFGRIIPKGLNLWTNPQPTADSRCVVCLSSPLQTVTTCHALSDGHFSNWVRQIIAHPCTLILFTCLPVRSLNNHALQRFEKNYISLFHAGHRLDKSNSGIRLALVNNLGGVTDSWLGRIPLFVQILLNGLV